MYCTERIHTSELSRAEQVAQFINIQIFTSPVGYRQSPSRITSHTAAISALKSKFKRTFPRDLQFHPKEARGYLGSVGMMVSNHPFEHVVGWGSMTAVVSERRSATISGTDVRHLYWKHPRR